MSRTISSSLSVREAKQRLHIPEDALVVRRRSAGGSERLDLFVDAATRNSRELPGTQFVIAGAGSQEQSLRQLVRNRGLERSVHFLGHRDDVYDVLRAMDLLLITSDQEGIPMALLEAMALEIPCVISRAVGGIPEVIEAATAAFCFPAEIPTRWPRPAYWPCKTISYAAAWDRPPAGWPAPDFQPRPMPKRFSACTVAWWIRSANHR